MPSRKKKAVQKKASANAVKKNPAASSAPAMQNVVTETTETEMLATATVSEVVVGTLPEVEGKRKQRIRRLPKYLWFVGGLVILVLVVAIVYYTNWQRTQQLDKNPNLLAQQEVKDLVSKVGKLAELPVSESPQVATVSDVTKLKSQSFFANAQNGDKVLIYTNAKKAYLYRPGTNKIVEIGPINIGGKTATAQQANQAVAGAATTGTPTPTQAVKPSAIVIYNGTNTVGLARASEKDLVSHVTAISVVGKGDTIKKEYDHSVIVDLTGKNPANAAALAQYLHASVATLPKGEVKPATGDILVILGTDYKAK